MTLVIVCTFCHEERIARPEDVTGTASPSYVSAGCGSCKRIRLHRAVLPDGAERKAEGQAAVAAAASEWTIRGRHWLRWLVSGQELVSEDVTAELGQPTSSGAVGALMTWAARQGLIVKVGRTQARRRNQHAAELTVWRRT